MPQPVRYLSTLAFDDTWLDEVRRQVPSCRVEQITAEKPGDVPDEVWREIEVLHTSAVLPDPDLAPRLRWVQLDTSGVDHVRARYSEMRYSTAPAGPSGSTYQKNTPNTWRCDATTA